MINYKTFSILYNVALEYDDFEYYMSMSESGWQDLMASFKASEIVEALEILDSVYRIARESLKDTRKRLGYSRAEFSRIYNIPIKTLENWDKLNNAPAYTEQLIKYSLFIDEINNEIVE